jgi:hypothetical protein
MSRASSCRSRARSAELQTSRFYSPSAPTTLRRPPSRSRLAAPLPRLIFRHIAHVAEWNCACIVTVDESHFYHQQLQQLSAIRLFHPVLSQAANVALCAHAEDFRCWGFHSESSEGVGKQRQPAAEPACALVPGEWSSERSAIARSPIDVLTRRGTLGASGQ